MLLGFDRVGYHADALLSVRLRLARPLRLARTHLGHDGPGFLIRPLEQIALAHQGQLDLMDQLEPFGPP